MSKSKRLTVRDIARYTGVSVGTVSMVINNNPRVAPATVGRVRAAMDELGFTPRSYTRNAAPARTSPRLRNVAFLSQATPAALTGNAYSAIMVELERQLRENGITMVFRQLDAREELPEGIDGVVLLGKHNLRSGVQRFGALPCVTVMGVAPSGVRWDHVTYMAEEVGFKAARYLIGQHRDTAHIIGRGNRPHLKARIDAFTSELEATGITVTQHIVDDIIINGQAARFVNQTKLADVVARIAQSDIRNCGFFCTEGLMLPDLYRMFAATDVPLHDCSIVGVDAPTELLTSLSPRPAVIDIKPAHIAAIAVKQLLARASDPGAPRQIIQIEPELIG